MIVCVPSEGEKGLDAPVAEHFGRAPTYTLFDTTTNGVRVIANGGKHNGGNGTATEHLLKENVEVVIAGGLGPKAVEMMKNKGIRVFVGAQGTVCETINLWMKGRLQRATLENACKDHEN